MPARVPLCVCILPLVGEILPVVVVMVPPAMPTEALIRLMQLNALLFITRGLHILMPLLTLNAMTLVEPDLKS